MPGPPGETREERHARHREERRLQQERRERRRQQRKDRHDSAQQTTQMAQVVQQYQSRHHVPHITSGRNPNAQPPNPQPTRPEIQRIPTSELIEMSRDEILQVTGKPRRTSFLENYIPSRPREPLKKKPITPNPELDAKYAAKAIEIYPPKEEIKKVLSETGMARIVRAGKCVASRPTTPRVSGDEDSDDEPALARPRVTSDASDGTIRPTPAWPDPFSRQRGESDATIRPFSLSQKKNIAALSPTDASPDAMKSYWTEYNDLESGSYGTFAVDPDQDEVAEAQGLNFSRRQQKRDEKAILIMGTVMLVLFLVVVIGCASWGKGLLRKLDWRGGVEGVVG